MKTPVSGIRPSGICYISLVFKGEERTINFNPKNILRKIRIKRRGSNLSKDLDIWFLLSLLLLLF